MRRLLLLLCTLALLAISACGGSDDEATAPVEVETSSTPVPGATEGSLPTWMAPILDREGPEVSVVFSTSDYAPGANRIGFLVVRGDGSLVTEPEATVWVGADEDTAEPVQTTARLVSLTPEGEPPDELDVTELYVAEVELPAAGRYWMAVEPTGAAIQGLGALDVQEATASPALGTEAPASDTPTLADAPAEEITTASPPDTELLRVSVADAIAAGDPFVVVFATPKYCQSRTCGPTVDVVDAVRRSYADSGIRFIHVEIYQDNDPTKGVNEWVREWGLPTEPWIFLVDGGGVVRAKFEGSVSQGELEDAVGANLL